MDNLRLRETNGEPWSLQSDKDLLKALQDLSGDIMSSIQRLENGINDLENDTARLSTGTSNAAAAFRSLSHSTFIEQNVATEAAEEDRPPSKRPPALTSDNFAEIVHPKYREALLLASAAFHDHAASDPGRLPHIFGSPEYLQDAGFGVEGSSGDAARQQAGEAASDAKEEAESAANGTPHDEDGASVPDFKSLLDAALRGELDASEAGALLDLGSASEPGCSNAKAAGEATCTQPPAESDSLGPEAAEGRSSCAEASAPEMDVSLEELLEDEDALFTEEELRG